MTAEDRAARAETADELCRKAFETAGCPEVGVALVAVGGYGRQELAPYSDLDVVLVLDPEVEAAEWAGSVWYPLWDSGQPIDHSVRTVDEVLEQTGADLRVALGMLDARHLAGDPNLTLRLRTRVLAAWRRDARRRLPELRTLTQDRGRRTGELADAAVPDLKESVGGLRDGTTLKALVATWLVDVPHADLERTRRALLDVRDALHATAGRATDRVAPEYWPDIAARLGLPDALAAQRHTRALGRRMTHVSRLTWRRVDEVLRAPTPAARARRPQLRHLGGGIAISHDQEVVLAPGVDPASDPTLLLRAAAEAAERDLVLAPATAARLVRHAPDLPDPWPDAARDLLVRLLGAGPTLLGVWETLDETGAVERLLPEWAGVRLLPHASTVHRYTVDRHLVQTCIEAAALVRRVARPDVLLVAALLHDIGKGRPGDHSIVGEPVARSIAARLGLDEREAGLVGLLVRHHLLLPETATTRDPDDPKTLTDVVDRLPDREALALFATLTEADARATSDKAWTSWRAGLVHELVGRCDAALAARDADRAAVAPPEPAPAVPVPERVRRDPRRVAVTVEETEHGATVTVVSGDRVGLLADCAALFVAQRAPVRAARAWPQRLDDVDYGVSQWWVDREGLDATVLRERLELIVGGAVDPVGRGGTDTGSGSGPAPAVVLHPQASDQATVLEVRAANRSALVHLVCRALAALDLTVRSAHVDTLGAQAVDVFYVQEAGAGALGDERAAAAAHAVRAALS